VNKKNSVPVVTEEHCDVQFDAVVTIAPRHDASSVDSEIPEAMVTCICQVGLNKGNWQKGTGIVICFWSTDSNCDEKIWQFLRTRCGALHVCGSLKRQRCYTLFKWTMTWCYAVWLWWGACPGKTKPLSFKPMIVDDYKIHLCY
jgi:hypothetical protein